MRNNHKNQVFINYAKQIEPLSDVTIENRKLAIFMIKFNASKSV